MTSAQSFKIYEILQKHFNNAEDAKIIVQEIEQIVENKVEAKKDVLSTKEDLLNVKTDLLNVKQDLIDRIHRAKIETIIWIVSVGILQFIASLLAKKIM
jgi:uncharacterized Zn finger protein